MQIFLLCVCGVLLGALIAVISSAKRYVVKLEAEMPRCVILTPKGFLRIKPEAFENIQYPKGKEPKLVLLTDEALDEISAWNITSALQYVANPKNPEDKKDIRKRYMTVLAALYGFEIPAALFMLDPGAKKLYDALLCTMRSVNPEKARDFVTKDGEFKEGSPHWEYIHLLNPMDTTRNTKLARYSLWKRYYATLEPYVIQTMLGQTQAMVFPLYLEFERKLQQSLHRKVHYDYSREEYQSVITAVAIRMGIHIPFSYFSYTPLTAILVETPREAPPNQLFSI